MGGRSRSGAGPESLRRAEHMDGVSRVYPAAKQFIAENADRVQQEKTRDQIGSTVQQSDLKQVVTLDGKGLPKSITIIYGPTGRATKTCDTLSGGIGYATAESYGQAVQFARMCQQVGLTSAATVAMLERQAAAVPCLNHPAGAGHSAVLHRHSRRWRSCRSCHPSGGSDPNPNR